jgi:uncharacterized Zn finger protein (UPF0148 family)
MYLRQRRRKEIKFALSKRSIGRSCPACNTPLEFSEGGKDRVTYFCPKCHDTITFTNAPDLPNKAPKKIGSTLVLRDKTKLRKRNEKEVETSTTDDLKIDQIRACMSSSSILSFAYNNHETGFTSRSVEPYKLTVDKVGDIVLYGYDIDAGSIRIFKLAKMKALEKQDFVFSPRWDIEDKLSGQAGSKKESEAD